MLISFEDSYAWSSCNGSGTSDDPFRGIFVTDNNYGSNEGFLESLTALNGSYVAVGTEFSPLGNSDRTPSDTFSITEGFGLECDWDGIHGTLDKTGTIEITRTDMSGASRVECVFFAIEYEDVTDLVFLSHPMDDGVIEYVA